MLYDEGPSLRQPCPRNGEKSQAVLTVRPRGNNKNREGEEGAYSYSDK
jgi:hypothetical protein